MYYNLFFCKMKHHMKSFLNSLPADAHGYTGLVNIGNTCFLNSCIQIINHIYELKPIYENVFTTHQKPGIPDTSFFIEWLSLHNLMWQRDGTVCPNRFVQIVHQLAMIKDRPLFTGFSQNDIHEFIHFFIESLHTSISREIDITIHGTPQNAMDELAIKCYNYLQMVYRNEYSEILNLFYGIYVSKIIGLDEKQTVYSTIPENFFILDLPIPEYQAIPPEKAGLPAHMFSASSFVQRHTLYDCFDLFTKEERMDGANSWFNETTGKKEGINKKIEFWNFPEILIISLKRFSHCGRRKRNDLVEYPIKSLELSRYVCGYNPQKYTYDLFGVCNHYVGCEGGHYTAFVLNYLDEWIHYNDGTVERGVSNIVTPSAYCLFYRITVKP